MRSTKVVFPFFSAATLFIAAFSAFAQAPRPDFNRPQTFDAQHYIIRVSFDREKKQVRGETTVMLKPVKAGFRVVELDAVDIAFDSVKLAPYDTDLQYKTLPGKIVITLDKTYGPEDSIGIVLKYVATPKKGVYFVAADREHSGQIWTQGEPDEARHWFPSFDFPSDKATTEQFISAEKGETVIGNGELIGKVETSGATETWHYKMPIPHSTYLVSFIIGKYERVADKYRDIPLGYYIYPGREQTARLAFGRTSDMMRVYERLTGIAYPYNKYDQTVVAKFEFGGMENITATTMQAESVFAADTEFGRDFALDLVSHELAHSWFGNLVTCRNWAELWLNEGFASYMEAVYREHALGRDDYRAKIRSDAAEFLIHDIITRRRHGLFNLRADKVSELFDDPSVTYKKGSAVLHMLREQIGTEAFWKAANIYLNRHKLANVESTDLRRAMEEASGQDLGWFFDQWVYGTGAPNLTVRQTYSTRSKTLTLTLTQTQTPDATTPAAFRLPLDLTISTATGKALHKVEMTKRTQTFTFTTASRPLDTILDPDEKIVVKNVKLRPIAVVR